MRSLELRTGWSSWRRTIRRRPAHNAARSLSIGPPDYRSIDAKWQKRWESYSKLPERGSNLNGTTGIPINTGKEFMVLPMFPYPSGTLHLGHFRVYTISDVIARFKRMQGYKVLHAMGWDAFGLPAENAAIERSIDPSKWTSHNIEKMKEQIKLMGGNWDWDRELMTCDPAFYKHTQKIFLLLLKEGLAYQADSDVNYDPVDKTVLANEQVDSQGRSWRSGAKVEQRRLKQWFFRITEFKESLLHDISHLRKQWPHHVLTMQENWLGKSEGASVDFMLHGDGRDDARDSVTVFTTRIDTLLGVQYIALALDHPIVQEAAKRVSALHEFIEGARNLGKDSKAGFLIPNLEAFNPLGAVEGAPYHAKSPLPVYATPYVLSDYGTGAVMGVPGHDARDFYFWQTNQTRTSAVKVIRTENSEIPNSSHQTDGPIIQKGILDNNCGKYSGLTSRDAADNIVNDLKQHGATARKTISWKIRDWLVSRQRYWGTPIPVIHCESCGVVPVPTDQLPVELPSLRQGQMKKGGNPLEDVPDWVNTKCPECQRLAKRETDTMDTFVDSSWYYMRFADVSNPDTPISPQIASKWMPVDIYIGGVEHAILHLLYARFIYKFLHKYQLQPTGSTTSPYHEPFVKLIAQGMVHGRTFSDPVDGRFLKPEEVDISDHQNPTIVANGNKPITSFEKMSKSKYNGVDPSICIAKYGADANRAHILFQAPIQDVLDWDEGRIVGIQRWFGRIWHITHELKSESTSFTDDQHPGNLNFKFSNSAERALWKNVQDTIASVSKSMNETFTLNTVVSDLMELTGTIYSTLFQDSGPSFHRSGTGKIVLYESLSALLRMMAPITPAFAEECWEVLHLERFLANSKRRGTPLGSYEDSVLAAGFPINDCNLDRLQSEVQPCAIQVNGRLRFATQVAIPPSNLTGDLLKAYVLDEAFKSSKAQEAQFKGVSLRKLSKIATKVIVARSGRTLNIVVDEGQIEAYR